MNSKKEFHAIRGTNGSVVRYTVTVKKNNYDNMFFWLTVLSIFISSIFLIRATIMYIQHTPKTVVSPIAHAQQIIKTSTQPTAVITVDTHKKYVLSKKHGDIIYRIWTNETSQGKNKNNHDTNLMVICEQKGMSNEFGFNPAHRQCFTSFERSADVIDIWFDDCLNENGLGDCLKKYSGNSDSYIEKFLSQSN